MPIQQARVEAAVVTFRPVEAGEDRRVDTDDAGQDAA